jgi:hypothetical protein
MLKLSQALGGGRATTDTIRAHTVSARSGKSRQGESKELANLVKMDADWSSVGGIFLYPSQVPNQGRSGKMD